MSRCVCQTDNTTDRKEYTMRVSDLDTINNYRVATDDVLVIETTWGDDIIPVMYWTA